MSNPSPSPEEVIDLLETIWVQIDPNQEMEWRSALRDKDLDVAKQAIIVLRDASQIKPSIRLFDATYRGLLTAKTRTALRHPKAEWFDEQRAKLRLVQQGRQEESHRAS
jgi:hypothetical protein